MNMEKIIEWVDAPKLVGCCFAVGTLVYLMIVTTRHHREFWEGIKGDDGKLQFAEGLQVVWLTLFVGMITADYSFGLVASEKAWWSMDTVLFIVSGVKALSVMHKHNRRQDDPK